MSRILKSGVYFVANQDLESFYRDAELSGWNPLRELSSGNPDTITPMLLDKNSTRLAIGANKNVTHK